MDGITRTRVFSEYERIYSNILDNIYPAKNSTGFPERNLSVNFSKAYEKVAQAKGETAFSWFELQFGASNNLHVDAVIVNTTTKELLIIESKRFSNPSLKIKEIGEDIDRIKELTEELTKENLSGIERIDIRNIEKAYGVILADVWLETPLKEKIYKSYLEGMANPESTGAFLNQYSEELSPKTKLKNIYYSVSNIRSIKKYNLVSFMWEL